MIRDGITSLRHARPPEHGTDAPMAHPQPGYRSRSTPGPTAVDRRRWFGLDRCNGHGLKARPGHRGTSCLHRVQHRSTIWLFLFADMVVAVHGGHESTSIGSPTPLLRSRVVQRTHIYAEKTSGRAAMMRPTRSAADYFAAHTTAPATGPPATAPPNTFPQVIDPGADPEPMLGGGRLE